MLLGATFCSQQRCKEAGPDPENGLHPPLLSVHTGFRVYRRAAAAYLAFNLSLSPLDLLQLHMQVLVLRRQRLHAVLEAACLLLGPSQLVTVDLVLREQSDATSHISRRKPVELFTLQQTARTHPKKTTAALCR